MVAVRNPVITAAISGAPTATFSGFALGGQTKASNDLFPSHTAAVGAPIADG